MVFHNSEEQALTRFSFTPKLSKFILLYSEIR